MTRAKEVRNGQQLCPRCDEWKDLSEYWVTNHTASGRRVYCKKCSVIKHKEWAKKYPLRYYTCMRKSREKVKARVLTHYGCGRLACRTCGENRLGCLTIDHIDGGGTKHFQEIGKYGSGFYQWLINNHYPSGFQTLCANCQLLKRQANNENAKAEYRLELQSGEDIKTADVIKVAREFEKYLDNG